MTYMDKLVGKLIAELDRQKLREKTMVVFFGDNGTANGRADRAMIGGRRLDGAKGSMLEGGSLEPLIVNWPGVTPAGKVRADMVDSSDFVPTFAELAGAKLTSLMAEVLRLRYAAKRSRRVIGFIYNSPPSGIRGMPIGS